MTVEPTYFHGDWSGRERNASRIDAFARFTKDSPICLFDLGAAGGTPPPFLFLNDHIQVVNFEPDERGVATIDDGQTTLPIAVGPSEFRTIYLNKRPTTSSLLPPNTQLTDRYDWSVIFGHNDDIFELVKTAEVETQPLDEALRKFEVTPPDFIKIDVQGLSLEVLQGGIKTIADSALGMEIEVEFFEIYKGQQTFGAIHEHIYAQGFEVFRVKNLNSWFFKTDLPIQKHTGQDIFCDFVYFRSLCSVKDDPNFWTPQRAVKVVLMLLMYDLIDAAAAYFEALESKIPSDRKDELRELITQWPGAVEGFFDEPAPPELAQPPVVPPDRSAKATLRRALSVSPMDVIRAVRRGMGGQR